MLVTSPGGWLANEARRHGAIVVEEPFRSSRSLRALLFGNAMLVRRISTRLAKLAIEPIIVQANDHTEGLLGIEIARRVGARSAIILRSSMMSRRDFLKYRCNEYDFISAVGEDFRARVQFWSPDRKIALIHDGIAEEEFAQPKAKPDMLPRRILVIGSPQDLKGWGDLADALFRLQEDGALPPLQFDFTGKPSENSPSALKLARVNGLNCVFLDRVDEFRDLVLQYDLVINPSRMETFGMAAVEVLAAGVPLISSRTGVIEQIIEEPAMLFPPGEPDDLAAALRRLFADWSKLDFGVARSQENIRKRFLIDRTVDKLTHVYEELSDVTPSSRT